VTNDRVTRGADTAQGQPPPSGRRPSTACSLPAGTGFPGRTCCTPATETTPAPPRPVRHGPCAGHAPSATM